MKIGIALSGGGVRGSAHLGIISALEEEGIYADMYSGTSAGAIVASFKSIGLSNEEILGFINEMDDVKDIAWWNIIKSIPNGLRSLESLCKGERIKDFLKTHLGYKFVSEVQKPLGITSCDLKTGAQYVFTNVDIREMAKTLDDYIVIRYDDETLLRKAVYSSLAIPGLFPPLQIDNATLVDGSIANNLPINIVGAMGADKIIAIDLIDRHSGKDVSGIWSVINRSVTVMLEQNMDLASKDVDWCVQLNPEIEGTGLLEFDQLTETYNKGYEYGKSIAPSIKKLL